MLIDDGIVGSSEFGKFEQIASIPVTNRNEEIKKYVQSPKGSSEAAIEMQHWHVFKDRVDRAWDYIGGVRLYENRIDPEKASIPFMISLTPWLIGGIVIIGAIVLFAVNLYK